MPDEEKLKKDLEETQQALKNLHPDSYPHRVLTREKAVIEAQLADFATISQKNRKRVRIDKNHANNVGRDLRDSIMIDGDQNIVNVRSAGDETSFLSPEDALPSYLGSIIATHQHLRFQGIRAGEPISVLLENIYVSLRAVDQREKKKASDREMAFQESSKLSIPAALHIYRRLVIVGDPGCGKTMLLSYIALTYAHALSAEIGSGKAGNQTIVQNRLGLNENKFLPILLPLRSLGRHLKEEKSCSNPNDDGPIILLNCLFKYYKNQRISLPNDFFDERLELGLVVLLLDGMDEVVDVQTRQRVARIIELFAARYPQCRFVISSREVSYEGATRIVAEFGLVKICEFSNLEVSQFVRDWTRVVETTLVGNDMEKDEIVELANDQAEKLISAIHNNPRVAELAVNPLMLTVIAIIHRYRTELPGRRSKLYEEAVDVLLRNWDAAKPGFQTEILLAGRTLDSDDLRNFLEPVAFWLHEHKRRELEHDDLRVILLPRFLNLTGGNAQQAIKALDAFLTVINERSGLLIERGIGVYGFAHLSFQEYLTARVLAEREDALSYSLRVLSDTWWREVLLLEAGYLSNLGTRRVSDLIRAILDTNPDTEPEPHYHLLLTAECLFDVEHTRLDKNLLEEVTQRLEKQISVHTKRKDKQSILKTMLAMNALSRIETKQFQSQYWKQPWGEPDWVTIPEGEFWMGDDKSQYDDERPAYKVFLPEYQIARVPITNAQYALYLQDVKNTKVRPPDYWLGNSVPPGLENHPVVRLSWYDAITYCRWLGKKIEKVINLPSEAEWEKAAKGNQGKREYPWGNAWRPRRCNSFDLGLNDTTPVGLFLNGESHYGLLDMSGNVWEWTRTVWDNRSKYPYDQDTDDNLSDELPRILRGGSFQSPSNLVRCTYRHWFYPLRKFRDYGFRVVVVSSR